MNSEYSRVGSDAWRAANSTEQSNKALTMCPCIYEIKHIAKDECFYFKSLILHMETPKIIKGEKKQHISYLIVLKI